MGRIGRFWIIIFAQNEREFDTWNVEFNPAWLDTSWRVDYKTLSLSIRSAGQAPYERQ